VDAKGTQTLALTPKTYSAKPKSWVYLQGGEGQGDVFVFGPDRTL